MTLASLESVIVMQDQAYATAVRKEAEKLRITDILTALTNESLCNLGSIGSISMDNPSKARVLRYQVGYRLSVDIEEEQLRMYGPHRIPLREIKSNKVKQFYETKKQELQTIYDNIELPF